jgi:hypothetical protein
MQNMQVTKKTKKKRVGTAQTRKPPLMSGGMTGPKK